MILVDVHSHLNHEKFRDRLNEVIQNAKKAGVKKIIVSGVNTPTNREVLELAKKFDIIEPSLGVYPIDALGIDIPALDEVGLARQPVKMDVDKELKFIEANKDKIIGVGEVGLDFKYLRGYEKKQKENFQKVIETTEKIKKPIIVHSRNAEKECIEMLESSKIRNVVMHCFTGNKKLIRKGADLGFNFSIPAVIKRLQHFQMLVENVNINQLLTETDAPWLSPELGRFSEPADVRGTITKIAQIKKFDEQEVANNIFMNYKRIFE